MTDLIDWYMSEKEKIDIDPIIFAVDFHYKFIRIHPFDDGNGRTVRILMNFILMQYGYTPAIVRTEEKDTYLYALRIADTGDISHFYRYIAEKVEQSLDTYLENLT
jgi:Fic family protein